MSDLTVFRDHARRMSTAHHRPECKAHSRAAWEAFAPGAAPDCPGCVNDQERHLWAQLADEVDNYLATPEEEGLFT